MYILLATIIKQDDRGLLSNKMTEVCIFHSCIFHVSSMMHIMCVSRKIGGRGIFSGYLFRCCFQEAVLFSGSGGTLRRGSLGGSHFEWEKFAPGFFYLHQVSWFCTKSRTGPAICPTASGKGPCVGPCFFPTPEKIVQRKYMSKIHIKLYDKSIGCEIAFLKHCRLPPNS